MKLFNLSAILLSAILVYFSGATASRADVVWTVDATFDDGTTLAGTFTTNVYGYLENNFSLTTQAKGAFNGFTYTSSDSYYANGTFYVDFQPGYEQDLHLAFLDSLSVPNPDNPILGVVPPNSTGPSYECINSFSCYIPANGPIRYIDSGFAAAVPEPSTWAMMVLGFCSLVFIGYRRRHSAVRFSAA